MLGNVIRFGGLYRTRGRRDHVGDDGSRISFLATRSPRHGPARTILLIHGAGMSARSWTLQLHGLSSAHRLLAMDLPGHGASDPAMPASVESYADTAFALLSALQTEPVFVVGHSLGGSVAIALAARHPECVQGLVLISSCARTTRNSSGLKTLLGSLPLSFRVMLFPSAAKSFLFALGATSEAVRLTFRDLRNCRAETIDADITAAEKMDLEDAAQSLRVPALILCGTSDIVTPLRQSEKLTELIPHARLRVIDHAGHMLPLEAPQRVNQEILAFVATVEGKHTPQSESIIAEAKRHLVRFLGIETDGPKA